VQTTRPEVTVDDRSCIGRTAAHQRWRTRLRLLAAVAAVATLLIISVSPARPQSAQADAPGGRIGVTQQMGIDMCTAPTDAEMDAWSHESPYWYVSLYIGGANRACPQENLDSGWVSRHAGGSNTEKWSFLLVYPGLQAPCGIGQTMSPDLAVAAAQGVASANDARRAASDLGFTRGTVIYYDMERYDRRDGPCREAVRVFIRSWNATLHRTGNKSGVYSAACDAEDWSASSSLQPADNVWIASWTEIPSVWNLPCVPNEAWGDDQRVHQFLGETTETYGGASINVDVNCASGHVANFGQETNPACVQR